MSHLVTINLLVEDLSVLAKACIRLGLELVRDQRTYRWYGRSVGDYPLPTGFTTADLGTCDHAIRIPGNGMAYEIGVVARRDGKPGYELLWDFYQGGYGLMDHVGEGAIRLQQTYAIEKTLQQFDLMHFSLVDQVTLDDQSVILQFAQQGV